MRQTCAKLTWHMVESFGEKFEEALAEKKQANPTYGLRTLARDLADGDPHQTEIIRRRLNKYRPPKGGGNAKVSPTEPTRREIEAALGLEIDSLKPDPTPGALSAAFLRDVAPLQKLWEVAGQLERGEIQVVKT